MDGKRGKFDPRSWNWEKILKRTLIWGGGALALLVMLLLIVLIFLGPIIKFSAEKIGSRVVGTQITVGSCSFSLLHGRLELRKFAIANPQGYYAPNALEFENFIFDFDMPTLLAKQKVVELIVLDGLNVNLQYSDGTTNLNVLKNNVDTFVARLQTQPGENSEQTDPNTPPPKEKSAQGGGIVIRRLEFTAGSLGFSSSTISTTVNIPLPPMALNDLGANNFGEACQVVFDAIIGMAGQAGNALKGLGTNVMDGLSGVGNVTVDAGKAVGNATVKAGKAVGNATVKAEKAVGNATVKAEKAVEDAAAGTVKAIKKLF
ncbi:MAG: hypothetical protein PHS41_01135 [Victivallaceae bacterium]|nr:hypothetical protein [Victivallaceae bacterium]